MNDLHLSLNFIFYVKKYKVLYSLKLGVNFTDVDILIFKAPDDCYQ